MFCEQPGGVEDFFPRVCFYVNQALARPPPRLCASIRTYLSSSSSMYLLLCVYVCSSVYVSTTVCIHRCLRTTVCTYTMYVCSIQRVCASSLPPCLLSMCVGASVLMYCLHVVSIVAVMGSSCRTYVVCGVVYVSIVSLGCAYYSRCVLLLIIVCTKKQVCMCLCTQQCAQTYICVQYNYKYYSKCVVCLFVLLLLLLLLQLLFIVYCVTQAYRIVQDQSLGLSVGGGCVFVRSVLRNADYRLCVFARIKTGGCISGKNFFRMSDLFYSGQYYL